MNRRKFGMAGLLGLFGINKVLIADENPGLPIVQFDKDGLIVNYEKFVKDIPFVLYEDYVNVYHHALHWKRSAFVWVPQESAVNRCYQNLWGKMLLVDTRFAHIYNSDYYLSKSVSLEGIAETKCHVQNKHFGRFETVEANSDVKQLLDAHFIRKTEELKTQLVAQNPCLI